jgi:hypothetical protein
MAALNWLASYPKSGSTWMRALIVNYLRDDAGVPSLDDLADVLPDIAYLAGLGRVLPVAAPHPPAVKTHFLPDVELLRPYAPITGKVVYLVRNPRDVILSAARHVSVAAARLGDFAEYFIAHRGIPEWEESGWGTWTRSVVEWTEPERVERHFPGVSVLTIRYEDMRGNPGSALARVVDFLELAGPVDHQRVGRAVERASLDRLRAVDKGKRLVGTEAMRDPSGRDTTFFGEGRTNQSLAFLGDHVEDSYQRLFAADQEFAGQARRFGYER